METIKIRKLNEVYNKIECEPSIAYELNDFFTFDVPGAKFMPSYRNKVWDGKIRLFNAMTCTLYGGLNRYLEDFSNSRKYEIEYDSDLSLTQETISSMLSCTLCENAELYYCHRLPLASHL